jgi:hypothetical protein
MIETGFGKANRSKEWNPRKCKCVHIRNPTAEFEVESRKPRAVCRSRSSKSFQLMPECALSQVGNPNPRMRPSHVLAPGRSSAMRQKRLLLERLRILLPRQFTCRLDRNHKCSSRTAPRWYPDEKCTYSGNIKVQIYDPRLGVLHRRRYRYRASQIHTET